MATPVRRRPFTCYSFSECWPFALAGKRKFADARRMHYNTGGLAALRAKAAALEEEGEEEDDDDMEAKEEQGEAHADQDWGR